MTEQSTVQELRSHVRVSGTRHALWLTTRDGSKYPSLLVNQKLMYISSTRTDGYVAGPFLLVKRKGLSMNKTLILGSLAAVAAVVAASPANATSPCPSINGSTNCGYIITVAPNGSVSGAATGAPPYDGVEDTLVGVINNSTGVLNSLTLSGANIFGFDGDGQAAYTGTSYGPTGYEGPNTLFNILNPSNGTVTFTNGGLAGGATAWFTLEENLATIQGGVQVGLGAVPEPATWAMMLLGFCGIGMAMRRGRKTNDRGLQPA